MAERWSLGLAANLYSGEVRRTVQRAFDAASGFSTYTSRAAIQYRGWGFALGTEFEPASVSWDWKDTALYALGVGCRPDDELDYLYEAKGPRVLPTYAVIPGMYAMGGLFRVAEIDFANLLHGEQGITLHRELPPNGEATINGRVRSIPISSAS